MAETRRPSDVARRSRAVLRGRARAKADDGFRRETFALGLRPRRRGIAPDKLGIDAGERAPDLLHEGEIGLPVAAVVPVEEDAADAARLAAVLEIKIVVAPGLELLMRGDRMRIARALHGGVERDRVGIILASSSFQHRREVGAAAEPG